MHGVNQAAEILIGEVRIDHNFPLGCFRFVHDLWWCAMSARSDSLTNPSLVLQHQHHASRKHLYCQTM